MNKVSMLAGLMGLCMGVASAQELHRGNPAPTFVLSNLGGDKVASSSLRNPGHPSFLFFINEADNVSRQAANVINKMVASYGNTDVKWTGIINAREDRARSYQAELNPTYTLLLDPQMSVIAQYQIKNSPTVVMIDENGKVARVWKGYSAAMMKNLNTAMANASGGRAQRFDSTGLPSSVTYGTPFFVAQPKNGG